MFTRLLVSIWEAVAILFLADIIICLSTLFLRY